MWQHSPSKSVVLLPFQSFLSWWVAWFHFQSLEGVRISGDAHKGLQLTEDRALMEGKAQQTTTSIYFVSGIFILYPFPFNARLLKTIKWCRLFSQWELQIGLRQLCLIYIFQSGKKSRLISLTDSGCPVIFHLLKWSSPRWWLVFALMPYLFKIQNKPP